MSVLESFILGLVQGLTEFLPVSSSGHTVIAGKLLGLPQVPMAFELTVHLASLLSVIIVLRKQVFEIIKKPLGRDMRLIIVATLPSALIVLLFKSFFEAAFSGEYLIYCFLITAMLLIISGSVRPKMIKPEISYFDAIVIGMAQGVAALPGISRSGSTISTAKMLGNSAENSTRFSFLISIPIIIGSAVFEFITNDSALGIGVLPLCVGFTAAFLSGLFGAALMTKIFSRRSLDGFAIYLFLLSVFLLCNDLFLGIF